MQKEVLESIIKTVMTTSALFNVTTYELFDLRDADSSNPDIFYQFGIMRNDYLPKPAFFALKNLIAELGT